MSDEPRRGRLHGRADAPGRGEWFGTLISESGVRIEEIVSSAHPEPVVYDQEDQEWVVVLEGAAVIDVGGVRYELSAGDWLFLPARTVHRVERTEAGTRWLAVHFGPSGTAPTGGSGAGSAALGGPTPKLSES